MRLAPLPVRRARKAATALHDRFHLRDPQDLDVEGIAALLGLHVRVGDLHGAAARLVGAPTGGIIRLSDRIEHAGVRRFSVAHEIGHCQLGHRSTAADAVCASADVHGHVDRGAEPEANAFAAELLMPEGLFVVAAKSHRSASSRHAPSRTTSASRSSPPPSASSS